MPGDTTRRGAGTARHRERPQILICNALASSANPIHHGPHHAGFFVTTMNMIEIGDCRETMRSWAAAGIRAQTCVTSPPYFGLRSYMPDAVKLRGDINPEELASVLKELARLGVGPCSHT